MQSFVTPESIVRVERMNKTFTKYHLTNGQVLHHFKAAADTHYHDHPWPFQTTILSGGYQEEVGEIRPDGTLAILRLERLPGTTHQVQAATIHKLVGLLEPDCWTMIQPGPKERDSGFYKANEKGVWHRYWYERTWRLLVPIAVSKLDEQMP